MIPIPVLLQTVALLTASVGRDPRLQYWTYLYLTGYVLAWLALQVWRAFGLACLRGWSR